MDRQSRGCDPQRLLPEPLEDRILGLLSQGAGGFLCFMSAAAWLSLLSWSVNDPSLTHATAGSTRNLLGAPGAVLSDLLLQTLGLASVFVLLPPAIWGLELALTRRVPDFRGKIALFPVSIVLLAGACSALPAPERWPLFHGLGGIIGDVLFNLLNHLLGSINPERSGFATGLVLAGIGLGTLAHNLGLSGRDLAFLLQPMPGDGKAGKTLWRRVADGVASLAVRPAAEDRSLPPARPAPAPRYEVAPTGPREQQAFAELRHDPQGGFHAGFADEARRADTRAADHDPIERGAAFDDYTDHASREMAERFAPGTGDEAVSGGKGLLRGFMRPRQQPAYRKPSLNLLKRPSGTGKPQQEHSAAVLRGTARLLEDVLADFGIKGEVKDVRPGPVVTLFELEPARGTKAARITALADDIARSMSATAVRVAAVPGRNVIGVELPNVRRETVLLRDVLEADAYKGGEATLPLALGKTIAGDPVVTDLARMPHLLVAGTTGSGKSVGVNAMILSLLYKLSPEDCRFLMIDPKMLELSVYNGIPHLLTPVITDPARAVEALNWAVGEMEERYKRMSQLGVRNIDMFNTRVRNAQRRGEQLARTVQTGFDARTGQPIVQQEILEAAAMPYIVVVVDEFADLMVAAGKEIEIAVQRLAQMARAAGIHLIMATQRPSVDIITGTIKANFPTRLSFKVASKIDSRTILNEQGAEQLLGQGDMLLSTGAGQLTRIHGPFVSDDEVEGVVAALRAEGEPSYVEGMFGDGGDDSEDERPATLGRASADDELYEKAVAVVLRDRKASTSYLQRRLGIGYNRAADLIDRMEREGLITPANGSARRDILVPSRDAASDAA